jgi:hypothetical protein
MNTYRDMYAVQVTNRRKAGRPPKYLTGFSSLSDAEEKKNHLHSKDTYSYKVVYIREYFHDDEQGHATLTGIVEIPEYYSI